MRQSRRTTKPCVSIPTSPPASNTRSPYLARNADQASDLPVASNGFAGHALRARGDRRCGDRQAERSTALDLRLVPPAFRLSVDAIFASYNLPAAEAVKVIESAMARHVDPEALFLFGAMLIRVGEPDRGLEVSANAVRSGLHAGADARAESHLRSGARPRAVQEDGRRGARRDAGGPEDLRGRGRTGDAGHAGRHAPNL